MVFDRALVSPGNENHVLDPRRGALFDCVLNEGLVDYCDHFFRDSFRSGEEPRAQSGHGQDCFAHFFHRSAHFARLSDWAQLQMLMLPYAGKPARRVGWYVVEKKHLILGIESS